MIQGVQHAAYIPGVASEEFVVLNWPEEAETPDEFLVAARQAKDQARPLVLAVNQDAAEPTKTDYIVAKPIQAEGQDGAVIVLRLTMRPEQQGGVLHLLNWSEKWLHLLGEATAREVKSRQWRNKLPTSRGWLLVLSLMVLMVVASMTMGTDRVSAPAFLEGSVQRVIVAPFEGYIDSATKQAGDTVKQDEVLAEMDAQALRLSQQQYESERDEYDRQYRQALSRRDMAEAHIHKLQINQADAQLSLIRQKLDKAQIRAPMDGVLITGDLRQSQGAPVKLGDVLFEVAPLDSYRLVIHVDERDVSNVAAGAQGLVNLRAIPNQDLTFRVVKVSPVFEDQLDSIAYRVEASLDNPHPALRPGMQGVAKIELGERSYLWIYLHELYDAIRLWLWKWLP